jgi:hypothetical protein
MLKFNSSTTLEDFYEKTYFGVRVIIDSINKLRLNENFSKKSFMNFGVFFFLKNIIIRIKKSFYWSKNFLCCKKIKNFFSNEYVKKDYKITGSPIFYNITFFLKPTDLVLKFMEKYKNLFIKHQKFWCFIKGRKINVQKKRFRTNSILKKACSKFILFFLKKRKKGKNLGILNKFIFFDCFFEYKIIFNL